MATLEEMAARLRQANPQNTPMRLNFMAQQFWPEADWLDKKCRNAGARRGAVAAAGVAGKLKQRGLLRRHIEYGASGCSEVSMWVWVGQNEGENSDESSNGGKR